MRLKGSFDNHELEQLISVELARRFDELFIEDIYVPYFGDVTFTLSDEPPVVEPEATAEPAKVEAVA